MALLGLNHGRQLGQHNSQGGPTASSHSPIRMGTIPQKWVGPHFSSWLRAPTVVDWLPQGGWLPASTAHIILWWATWTPRLLLKWRRNAAYSVSTPAAPSWGMVTPGLLLQWAGSEVAGNSDSPSRVGLTLRLLPWTACPVGSAPLGVGVAHWVLACTNAVRRRIGRILRLLLQWVACILQRDKVAGSRLQAGGQCLICPYADCVHPRALGAVSALHPDVCPKRPVCVPQVALPSWAQKPSAPLCPLAQHLRLAPP